MRAGDDEKAIVSIFLRNGHPWMAFCTVLLKSGSRAVIATALVSLALGQGTNVSVLLKFFHLPL